MTQREKVKNDELIESFLSHVRDKDFPCIASHDAVEKETLKFFTAQHIGCPADDKAILSFLYSFVDHYRTTSKGYHSAAVLFAEPGEITEEMFEYFFWQRLQAIADLDALQFPYDDRVSSDPLSPQFSFSIKSEAFYIIGLHPANSRLARRLKFPALIFNPHSQFERLREQHVYHKMQSIVRKRDVEISGSVNPMLSDFGNSSEASQYSGRHYPPDWTCPLSIKHGTIDSHTTP
jgi:hypothetical protein